MSSIDLKTDTDQLIVDDWARSASAHTFITYRALCDTIRVRLQSRLGTTAPWGNVPLAVVMLDPDGNLPRDFRSVGRFRTPELRPGEMYQVRALVEGSETAEDLRSVIVRRRDLSLGDTIGA